MKSKKIIEVLLKLQMDDLKDAEMLKDYAEEMKELGEHSIAASLASRAKQRLNQVTECENSIHNMMEKMKIEAEEMGHKINTDENEYKIMYRKFTNEKISEIKKDLELL
jgi:DNA-binding protein H-NS